MTRPLPLYLLLLLLLHSPHSVFSQGDISKIEVVDGLTVSSAVKPGLVAHPMMATVDDTGRLFVAESSGVNLKPEELEKDPPHSIRLLTDTDQDGVYDKATTFVDKLNFPQGALWVYDSLYVMSPPSLWRFRDDDNDGVAEVREEMVTGFEYTGNAADVHGPFLHPNGRLYWCHGRKGHKVVDPETGNLVSEAKGARIWSCDINGGDVQVFAGGGMDNPVEVDFTDAGDIVGSVNLFYGRPRGDTLVHWLYGGAYPRYDQELVIEEFPKTGDLLKEFHNFGHVAISGMCRYRSGTLIPEWRDQWFTAHFNTSEITRTRTRRSGASYAALETETILRMNQPDAHLTDVLEDRNGDLLVIDTGGWFRIGCPTSQIAKPDVVGGIYRVSSAGRKSPRVENLPWATLTAETVSRHLDARQPWLRERSMIELAMRGHPSIPELQRILESPDSSSAARCNAVWTLSRMKFSDSPELILKALMDPDSTVRIAACNAIAVTRSWQTIAANEPNERAIELERNRTISGALVSLVRTGESAQAAAAAVALGRMGDSSVAGPILNAAGRAGTDRALQHALIYALIELNDPETTRYSHESENPLQVAAALRALQEMKSTKLEVLDVLPALESENAALRTTALEIAKLHPDWDAAIANRFLEWRSDLSETRRNAVIDLAPNFLSAPPMLSFLSSLMLSEKAEENELGFDLVSKSKGLEFQPEWEDRFRESIAEGEKGPHANVALNAIIQSGTKLFADDLKKIANDPNERLIFRIKALQAISGTNAVLSDDMFTMLAQVLKNEGLYSVRSQAIDILSTARLTKEKRNELAKLTAKLGPLELPRIFEVYRRIDSPEQADFIAGGIVASNGFRNLDFNRVRQKFITYPEVLAAKIAPKIEEIMKERSQRAEKISSLNEQLSNGDVARGKVVFESGKGTCIVCHQIGETGRDIGPNLSTIGRIRKGSDLLESIIYPSESLARDFETYAVELSNGSPALTGVIRRESAQGIVLVDLAGQSHEISRKDIAKLTSIPMSLMPAGLDQTLKNEELIDLVAYLLSLK